MVLLPAAGQVTDVAVGRLFGVLLTHRVRHLHRAAALEQRQGFGVRNISLGLGNAPWHVACVICTEQPPWSRDTGSANQPETCSGKCRWTQPGKAAHPTLAEGRCEDLALMAGLQGMIRAHTCWRPDCRLTKCEGAPGRWRRRCPSPFCPGGPAGS